MQIKRAILLKQLFDFCQQSHGVVIGKPGVGKSHLLRELKGHLLDNKILAFIIKVDNTENATDESIQEELGIGKDKKWIDTLKNIKLSSANQKAILIFDAFDAARDERARKDYLSQIKRAKKELSEKWNIIVSVRTYDATKSPELISLFPIDNYNATIACRNFEIPLLNSEEVEDGLKQNSLISSIYYESAEELKKILRSPYFLILLENILKNASAAEIKTIKIIKSETQLLSTYWKQKITNTQNHLLKEKLLLKITNILIKRKSLSCSKSLILEKVTPEDLVVFEYLRSENILDEFSTNGSRIGYSHNILFDYSVSRLCISADSKSILDFINVDLSRPFFLRPSFVYFFTQLWYDDNVTYWRIYWEIQKDQRKEVQLFIRLVLNAIIASEYNTVEELNPILKHSSKLVADTNIQHLLQSIRFVKESHLDSNDIKLLNVISSNLDLAFLWEFSFLLEKAINSHSIKIKDFNTCGVSVRNFFKYILQKRNEIGINKSSIDRLGSTRGIGLLAKTYKTNPSESRKLLEEILKFLNDPNFEIWYFTSLTEDIKYIVLIDPEFVSEVYYAVFDYTETSDEKTSMGSVTLNLISNRKQDFGMCYYRLVEFYPKFIEVDPLLAIKTGLHIVNKYVIEDKLHSGGGVPATSFELNSLSCVFISDLSSMWQDMLSYHRPAQIAEKIIDYLGEQLILKKVNSLQPLFDTYFANAKVGFTWKVLIKLGIKHPDELKDYLFPLSTAEVLLLNGDTIYELGQFIERCANKWSKTQLKKVEKSILGLLKHSGKAEKEYLKIKVAKLLNTIPKDKLQLKASIDFVSSNNKVKNEPTFESSFSSTPYTTEEWLKDQGVDIEGALNSQLLKSANSLEPFTHKFLNSTPIREDYIKYLEIGQDLFIAVLKNKSKLDAKIIYSCLNNISKTSSIISRNIDSLTKDELDFIKKSILYCYNYISEYDKGFNESSSPSSGYSPTPRIEAAGALINLVSKEVDTEIVDTILLAANDKNPIVRFNLIKNISSLKNNYPQEYWSLLQERIEKENNSFTLSVLINNIRTDSDSMEIINKIIEIASKKLPNQNSGSSFIESFANLLLYLYAFQQSKVAKSVLDSNLSNLLFSRTLVFKIFQYIDPSKQQNNYVGGILPVEPLFGILQNIINQSRSVLKSINVNDFKNDNPPLKATLETIDHLVQRIYFALDINSRIGGKTMAVTSENRKAFYFKIKPFLKSIIEISSKIDGGGIILAHTAHYFIQTLNGVVAYDAKDVLAMAAEVTKYSIQTGYAFDSSAIKEVVNLTEKILADNRDLLLNKDSFNDLISLLDIYINAGWTDALELLWKLDEIFK